MQWKRLPSMRAVGRRGPLANFLLSAALAVMTAAIVAGCKKSEPSASTEPVAPQQTASPVKVRSLTIVVIGPRLPQANDGYWLSVRQGAERAATEMGVNLEWRSPPADITLATLPAYATTNLKGCDAALFAPENQETLVPVVEATHKKMPVVLIDAIMKTDQVTAIARTDQSKAGELAAQQLASALGTSGGKIAIIGAVPSPTGLGPLHAAATTGPALAPSLPPIPATTGKRISRLLGFEQAIEAHPNIQIVAEPDSPVARSAVTPLDAARSELQANPDLSGIFCLDATDGVAVLQAVSEAKKTGLLKNNVRIIACGSSPQLRQAVADKVIDALIVENGQDVGYQGVKTVVDALRSKTFAKETLLTPTVVTLQNLSQQPK